MSYFNLNRIEYKIHVIELIDTDKKLTLEHLNRIFNDSINFY